VGNPPSNLAREAISDQVGMAAKRCVAVVSNPIGKNDTGGVACGNYVLENDTVVLTDEHGEPLRDEDSGARFMHRLERGDNEQTIAKRLTLRHHRAANRDEIAGWRRRINYGRSGLA
jgi:hypothetical protein